jgi:hypothetical protein
MPADAIAATLWFAYDPDRLYLALDVQDETHAQPYTDGGMWQGDSLQFGVAPHAPDVTGFPEFTVGRTEAGTQVYRNVQPDGESGLHDATDAQVRHENGRTVYEVGVPWSALPVSPAEETIRLSLLVNDNDGDGRRGWIEWASGIGSAKDPQQFRPATLERSQ